MESFWKQGMILEIPLEKNLGFTYVKVILTEELGYPKNIILKPLNLLQKQSAQNSNMYEDLKVVPQLFYDLLILNTPKRRGADKWREICVIELNEKDKEMPMFRMQINDEIQDWSQTEWYLIDKLIPNGKTVVKYSEVKKLGISQHSTDNLIRTKLTFFWLVHLELNIRDFYTKEEFENNMWYKYIEAEANNMET